MHIQKPKGIIAFHHLSHNITAAQLLKQLRQTLPYHLLNLLILVILLVLMLSTMLLPSMLLLAVLLSVILTTVLLATMLLLLLLSRVATATILGMLRRRGHVVHRTALKVHVNATLVFFSLVLETQLTANLFDPRLDLLHMIPAVVSFANDDMQMILAPTPRRLDTLFKHILSFLDEKTVKIDSIFLNTTICIVLAENVVARLSIVLLHFGGMLFSFFRKLVGACAVTRFVGLMGTVKAGASLCSFLAREIAETVVFSFGIAVGVVERWEVLVGLNMI